MNGSKVTQGEIVCIISDFSTNSTPLTRLWLQLQLYKGVQSETMQSERHSEPIVLFVPIAAKDQRIGGEVIDRLGRLVDDLVCHLGIDEDGLVREISSSPSQN
jgi:hypothetical protein